MCLKEMELAVILALFIVLFSLFSIFSSLLSKLTSPLITKKGTYYIDGYMIRLVSYCNEGEPSYYEEHPEECLGVSDEINKVIDIKTNQTLSKIKRVCNHEVCHTLIQDEHEEELCRDIENTVNYPICNKFIEAVTENG